VELSRFEREAIGALIVGEPDEIALRAQLNNAEVLNRELTGVGVLVALKIPSHIPPRSLRPNDVLGAGRFVQGRHPKLENGAGLLLFMRDGFMHVLEAATYGAETWPETDADFEVHQL
jgi:hypothetical protein